MTNRVLSACLILSMLLILVEFVLQRQRSNMHELLPHAPHAERVMILGNSMFKTGIDFEQLSTELPSKIRVDFNYYNGYYSNLWYLIAKNALGPAPTHPQLLVWGFRANFAIQPAFRVNKLGSVEEFTTSREPVYDSVVTARRRQGMERIRSLLYDHSDLYALRPQLRERFDIQLKKIGLLATSKLVSMSPTDLKSAQQTPLGDLIFRRFGDGNAQMTEEKVNDGSTTKTAGQFVQGPKLPLEETFVPLIAAKLKEKGIPQLVILHQPKSFTSGAAPPKDVRAFHDSSIIYLQSEGIPFVDLAKSKQIVAEDYASGDHYNASGRAKVTSAIAAAITELTTANQLDN